MNQMEDMPHANRPTLVPELYVSQLSASLSFYVDLLGFRVDYERPEQRFAAIHLGNAHIMLEEAPSLEKASVAELRAGEWRIERLERPFGRGVNLEIEVPDVDAIATRLASVNYSFVVEPHFKAYRVGRQVCEVRQFVVGDPDGYLIRPSQALTVR